MVATLVRAARHIVGVALMRFGFRIATGESFEETGDRSPVESLDEEKGESLPPSLSPEAEAMMPEARREEPPARVPLRGSVADRMTRG